MSLGMAIKGPEGIVLAAESRMTLMAHSQDGQKPMLQVTYDNATKLFTFDGPHRWVGVLTYGLAAMGARSAYSFVPEIEVNLPEERKTVEFYAKLLADFYMEQWKKLMSNQEVGDSMAFVVAGFNDREPYGRVYLFEIPNAPEPEERNAGDDEFGVTWGGQLEIVHRLVQGYDPRVLQIAKDVLRCDSDAIADYREALRSMQLPLPLNMMPLQDCVDLAMLLMRATIDTQRLTVGVRGCGGAVDLAVVTRAEGAHFVRRKQISVDDGSTGGQLHAAH
jgi:hypothetical protein